MKLPATSKDAWTINDWSESKEDVEEGEGGLSSLGSGEHSPELSSKSAKQDTSLILSVFGQVPSGCLEQQSRSHFCEGGFDTSKPFIADSSSSSSASLIEKNEFFCSFTEWRRGAT